MKFERKSKNVFLFYNKQTDIEIIENVPFISTKHYRTQIYIILAHENIKIYYCYIFKD